MQKLLLVTIAVKKLPDNPPAKGQPKLAEEQEPKPVEESTTEETKPAKADSKDDIIDGSSRL